MPSAVQMRGQTQDPSHFTPWEADPNRGPIPQQLETAVNTLRSSTGCVPSSPSHGGLFSLAAELLRLKLPILQRERRRRSLLLGAMSGES